MTTHIHPEHLDIARVLCNLLEQAECEDELAAARLLSVRLARPQSYVTLVGETSTGKSSLANGLLIEPLLPAFAEPTTATVTHVALREAREPRYHAIFRDGAQQEIDRATFLVQSAEPMDDLLRLQLRCSPSSQGFDGLQVFDTPGYNAILAKHEEILRAFIPSSDLVVFVAGYRTGFGQVDQDLLEVVKTSLEDDPDIPVVLVINRAPPGTTERSKRVVEIVDNATDCLAGSPILHIVPSTTYMPDGSPPPDPAPPPDTRALWGTIRGIVDEPERQAVVANKLVQMLRLLMGEADDKLERNELRLTATGEELEQMRAQVEILRDARTRSFTAVDASTTRLRNNVEPAMRRAMDSMLDRLSKEVDDSNKWLDAEGCAAWLTEHAMPFEARKAAKMVESIIDTELQRLNRELEDIANTAVQHIERTMLVRSDAARRFTFNLVRTVVQRVGGSAISSGLKALGGVGGVAAGTGNLVKMIVSRAGKLVGKTFGREVYNQIGRIFTKRMVQRMAGALQVLLEVIVYVYEAKTWQKKMKKELAKSVEAWKDEVLGDLRDTMLPSIREANLGLVRTIYDDLIEEHAVESGARRRGFNQEVAKIGGWRRQIADLGTRLDTLSPTPSAMQESP